MVIFHSYVTVYQRVNIAEVLFCKNVVFPQVNPIIYHPQIVLDPRYPLVINHSNENSLIYTLVGGMNLPLLKK